MTAEPDTNPSMSGPMDQRPTRKPVSVNRCKAHRKNGEQCKKAALTGATVCRMHGGAAKQVVNAARVRLQNAANQMAKELLGIATDTTVPEGVRLAAVKDALDRAGLKPVTAVDLDISTKPWEAVMEGIAKVVAGPRYSDNTPAIEGSILEDDSDNHSAESDDDVVVGEFDDDVIEDDLLGVQPQRESVDILDVEVEGIDPSYNDAGMSDGSGTTTPDQDQSQPDDDTALPFGPLGPTGPTGSGLMSLQDATAAVADIRARHAARMREMRRR